MMRHESMVWICIATACVALAVRIALIQLPVASNDWASSYKPVSQNILWNGCVSLSPPEQGVCTPSWGGHHLPGLPAYAALVMSLTGEDESHVMIATAALTTLVIVYLMLQIRRFSGSARLAFGIGMLLAVDPLSVGYIRHMVSTEALTVALGLGLLAEMIGSLADGRLRGVRIGLWLLALFFVRYDTVFLALSVAVAGMALHGFFGAWRRAGVIILIPVLGLGGWWVRSVALGLPWLPKAEAITSEYHPVGYIHWFKTWTVSSQELAKSFFPLYSKRYSDLRIPARAYASEREREHVSELIEQLRAYDGQPFPREIDARFAELAAIRGWTNPSEYIEILARRSLAYWASPLDLHLWPVEQWMQKGGTGFFSAKSVSDYFQIIRERPGYISIVGGLTLWRAGLFFGGVLLLVYGLVRKTHDSGTLVLGVVMIFALAKTAFHALLGYFETRYTVPVTPLLEVGILLALYSYFVASRRDEKGLTPGPSGNHHGAL